LESNGTAGAVTGGWQTTTRVPVTTTSLLWTFSDAPSIHIDVRLTLPLLRQERTELDHHLVLQSRIM